MSSSAARKRFKARTGLHRRPIFESLEARQVMAAITLDPTFGTGGIAEFAQERSGVYEFPSAMAVQPDGKTLIGGITANGRGASIAITRLNPDGTVDTSFGSQGSVITVLGSQGIDFLTALTLQPDGRILAAGSSDSVPILLRYTASGQLDSTFDGDGILPLVLDGLPLAVNDIDVQEGGRVIVTGQDGNRLALMALTSNGSLDTSFAGGAGVTWATSLNWTSRNTELTSDGSIVVAGRPPELGSDFHLRVARWSADGVSDTTFGDDGTQDLIFSGAEVHLSGNIQLTIDDNDRIIVAADPYLDRFHVVRLDAGGDLDHSFGGDGIAEVSFGAETMWFGTLQATVSVAVDNQTDEIYLAASIYKADEFSLALARFESTGSIDTSFGDDGIQVDSLDLDWDEFIIGMGLVGDRLVVVSEVVEFTDVDGLLSTSRIGAWGFELDGARDTTYGVASRAVPIVSEHMLRESPSAWAMQPDGKILVISQVREDVSIYRFHQNGRLDLSFGQQGIVRLNERGITGSALAVQADGKILVGAGSPEAPFSFFTDASLTRLNPDGSFDLGFGDNGTLVLADVVDVVETTIAVQVLSDNSLVAVVARLDGFVFHHVLSTGVVDATFGGGQLPGYVTEDTYPRFIDWNVLGNGNIQFVAQEDQAVDLGLVVGTILPDGTIDSTFGVNGIARLSIADYAVNVQAAAWQSDGSIVIAGAASDLENQYGALLRVTPACELDPTFGSEGLSLIPSGESDSFAFTRLHVLSDDRLIAAALVLDGFQLNIEIAQFLPDGALDADFAGGTKTLDVNPYSDTLAGSILLDDISLLLIGSTQKRDGLPLFLARTLVDTPWQNSTNPLNVSGDVEGNVYPIDALLIINTLNDTINGGPRYLGPASGPGLPYYYDVNGDGWVTALDALMVINWLNRNSFQPAFAVGETEGEGESVTEPLNAFQDSSLDSYGQAEQLDAAAVAMLLSSLEADQKRR